MKKKTKYLSMILGIIVISSGLVGIYLLVTLIESQSPLGKYGPGTVYDPQLQKTIIFGGGTQQASGFNLFNDM